MSIYGASDLTERVIKVLRTRKYGKKIQQLRVAVWLHRDGSQTPPQIENRENWVDIYNQERVGKMKGLQHDDLVAILKANENGELLELLKVQAPAKRPERRDYTRGGSENE